MGSEATVTGDRRIGSESPIICSVSASCEEEVVESELDVVVSIHSFYAKKPVRHMVSDLPLASCLRVEAIVCTFQLEGLVEAARYISDQLFMSLIPRKMMKSVVQGITAIIRGCYMGKRTSGFER